MRNFSKFLACLAIGAAMPVVAYAQSADDSLIKRGEYVSREGDCIACHTALHGKAYAGGLEIKSPIGVIYSTNITPDSKYGIGNYTLADFTRALRDGVRKDGSTLYPAMPYAEFALMPDEDIKALYEYFMHGVQPEAVPNKPVGISWPMSMRWPLSIWKAMFVGSPKPYQAAAGADPVVARGEYLVNGPGHCGECHTPRGFAMQQKALTAAGGPVYLSGGAPIDNWVAPSLRSDPIQGLGGWSEEDIFTFLKTGRIDRSAVFGGMADVVAWSTQHLSDDDLRAIAKYLKSTAEVPVTGTYQYDSRATQMVASGQTTSDPGAAVYRAQCSICHKDDGSGVARMFPPLANNPVVVTENPTSLVNVISFGGVLPATNLAPSSVAMPGFVKTLSDQQIADVTNFIRKGWGNHGVGTVSASDVRKLRQTGAPVSTSGWNATSAGWFAQLPQPYGHDWTFSPQTHSGVDEAQ